MKNAIYGLVDPTTNELRYIGKAKDPFERYRDHVKLSNLEAATHKNHWIKKLLSKGLKPELIIIEECSDMFSMDEAEDFWIQYYKSIGARLTNSCNGGKGTPGFKHREESLALMSEKAKNRDWTNFVPANKQQNIMIDNVEHRLCTWCDAYKPLSQFHWNKKRNMNQPGCKPCRKERQRKYREKNPSQKLSPEEFKATYINRKKRTDPISEEQKQLLREKRSKPLIATNIETGEVLEFASALEAKKQGFQNTNIGQAIKHNKIYRGYVWKFKS